MTVGRKRTINAGIKDLPRGFRRVNGLWYWRPTNEQTRAVHSAMRAGGERQPKIKTVIEARRWWVKTVAPLLTGAAASPGLIDELLDRFVADELPLITNPRTREQYVAGISKLRQSFGSRRYAPTADQALRAGFVRPPDVAQYLRDNLDRKNASNKEIKLLGRVFRLAIARWGLTTFNPTAGVEYHKTPPRDAYIDDELFRRMIQNSPQKLALMLSIMQQTGMRSGMVFSLDVKHAEQRPHMRVAVNKQRGGRARFQLYSVSADLALALEEALSVRRKEPGLSPDAPLFQTRAGRRYSTGSVKRLWETMRKRVGFEPWEYTMHDMRAKAGSDADSDDDAKALLSHASAEVTRRHYRRKPGIATPNRSAAKPMG